MRLAVIACLASCGYPQLSDLSDLPSPDAGSGAVTDAADQLPVSLELLAGSIGSSGNLDGMGTDARFGSVSSIALDDAGNFYIADTSQTIRKISPTHIVTTIAGASGHPGNVDGAGSAARFNFRANPGIVQTGGNLYVSDDGNRTIRKVTLAGVVTTIAGDGQPGFADGIGLAARFQTLGAMAVDGSGTIYVTDTEAIRKITPAGVVTTFAGIVNQHGTADGTGSAARFELPQGVAVDNVGNVYVADTFNNTIRKVTPAGVVTTLAGTATLGGTADGTGAAARFAQPTGIAVSAGQIYVADSVFGTVRLVTTAGVVTTVAGSTTVKGTSDGIGTAATFSALKGLAADSYNVYLGDGSSLRDFKPFDSSVTTLAGRNAATGSQDASGAAARFYNPSGVAVDNAGVVYVADSYNQTVRRITPAGSVTTLVGTAGMSGTLDGTGAAARMAFPAGVAIGGDGVLYATDEHTIRAVLSTGEVTTLAGSPTSGFADGTGTSAQISGGGPDLTFAPSGDAYLCDSNSVRRFTRQGAVGTITTIAGNHMAGTTDGAGSDARFDYSAGITASDQGIYVADGSNTIRMVSFDGNVVTLAGTADVSGSADGVGATAAFNRPGGLAVDPHGNVYVADRGNSTIRKIDSQGTVSTIAGTPGVIGMVLGSSPGFAQPEAIAVFGDSLIIVDTDAVLILRHGAQ